MNTFMRFMGSVLFLSMAVCTLGLAVLVWLRVWDAARRLALRLRPRARKRRSGTLGPWDGGTLGRWDFRTVGPWDFWSVRSSSDGRLHDIWNEDIRGRVEPVGAPPPRVRNRRWWIPSVWNSVGMMGPPLSRPAPPRAPWAEAVLDRR